MRTKFDVWCVHQEHAIRNFTERKESRRRWPQSGVVISLFIENDVPQNRIRSKITRRIKLKWFLSSWNILERTRFSRCPDSSGMWYGVFGELFYVVRSSRIFPPRPGRRGTEELAGPQILMHRQADTLCPLSIALSLTTPSPTLIEVGRPFAHEYTRSTYKIYGDAFACLVQNIHAIQLHWYHDRSDTQTYRNIYSTHK